MKKILLSIICFLAGMFSIHAQTLYGTTKLGGKYASGTICKFTVPTNELTAQFSFEGENFVSNPYNTKFTQAGNGKLYAMTRYGGANKRGVIFSYDPSTNTIKTLKDFEDRDKAGYEPTGGFILASDGKLYGLTAYTGISAGAIFSFDPSNNTYTKIFDFDATIDGIVPTGSLMQASNGKFYGTTELGGTNGLGVIFSFDPSSYTFTKLFDFDEINGAEPEGDLIQASNGKLYGLAPFGGSNGRGVIFSFDPLTSIFTKMKDFDASARIQQYGASLVRASNGKLYGTTNQEMFSLDPVTSDYIKVAGPVQSLIQASNGKLYGIAGGGARGRGDIFSFDPLSSVFTKLKDFDGTNGAYPQGSLCQASDGTLYGLTAYGGTGFSRTFNGPGVIFSFIPSTGNFKKLKDLFINTSGRNPAGSLLQASNGKLYGLTTLGGSLESGVIFSFDPASLNYSKIHDFDIIDGAMPLGSMVQATNGKLYGVTSRGGSDDLGVLFSFDPSTNYYTNLRDIENDDRGRPVGNLMQAKDGKLYGMKSGYIFSFDPSTSTFKKFDGSVGSNIGSLVQAGNGKLYGLYGGGSFGYGGIFSFDPSTSTITMVKCFTYTDGANPLGSLLQANNGILYGITSISFLK